MLMLHLGVLTYHLDCIRMIVIPGTQDHCVCTILTYLGIEMTVTPWPEIANEFRYNKPIPLKQMNKILDLINTTIYNPVENKFYTNFDIVSKITLDLQLL